MAAEESVVYSQHVVAVQLNSSEYALHAVFTQFEALADNKINLILSTNIDQSIDIKSWLGQDVDPVFDKLIRSLGSIGSHRPRPVIDAVMQWRKSKNEPVDQALIRKVSESAPLSRVREVPSVLKERLSLSSIFILCRTLIEVVKRLNADNLSDDLAENLEEIVFNQLKNADPELIHRSKNRTASMDLFAELIGALSNIRFVSVSDRFIAELEKYNYHAIMKEKQNKIEMLIRGMRYLKIKIYPLDALEETADFLQSCAGFFKNAHGAKIKHAYAKMFIQLLLPVAAVAVAEVNFPAWSKTVDLIYPRALKMTLKPRRLMVNARMSGFPLMTTLLCVSRKEFFIANWYPFVENCLSKFNKDKHIRVMSIGCLSRLIWVYLFRCNESTSATFKKLDGIVKTLFPSMRRAINPTEVHLDHFVQIIYFILMRDIDHATKNIVFNLLNTDSIANVSSAISPLDVVHPEKMMIAIMAFQLVLNDLEKGETRPPFPINTDMTVSGIPEEFNGDSLKTLPRGVRQDLLDRLGETISKVLIILDSAFGRMLVIDDKNITWRPGSSNANAPSYSVPSFTVGGINVADSSQQVHHQYAAFSATYTRDKQPYIDLLKVIVGSMPRISTPGIALPKIVELLARYTTYVDPDMIRAASLALVRLAKDGQAQTVVSGYSRFVYRIEDRYAEVVTSLANGPTTGGNFNGNGGVLKLYTDLLMIWVEQLDVAELKRELHELESATQSDPKAIADLQSKLSDIYSMIEEIEANGLLFLCSKLSAIRRPAIQILKLVSQVDARLKDQLGSMGTSSRRPISMTSHRTSHIVRSQEYARIYDLLEHVGQPLIKFDKDSNILLGRKIAIVERIRLQQHQRRDAKHVLIQLAESDHTSDITIWETLFPEVAKLCFEHFPGTVALCRQNICTRLLQLQSLIQAAVDGNKLNNTGTLSMAKAAATSIGSRAANPELIDQWKTYLMFTCSTSTLAQDRLPTTTWANSGRKQSAVVERIASTRDLFRMIMQFLTCEHRTIREAAVQGLGTINKDVYKVLMEDMQLYVRLILEDSKQKSVQKPYQYKRIKKHDRLRIAVMNVFQLTADCLADEVYIRDKTIMDTLMSYVKETKTFLADTDVQLDWEFHRLRVYLCRLVEKLYEHISKLDDPSSIMSFETRLSLFKMFEEWCGYGTFASVTRTREATMMRDVLEQCKDSRERGEMTKLMEEERKALETAALSGMAALCRGSVYAFIGQKKARQAVIQFDIVNLLRWIDAVFESHDTKYHVIARRALEAVLIYNQDQALLLDDIIEQCYAGNPKLEFTQGYFLALADIITRVEDYPCHIHQIMSVALFKAGDAKKTIRKAAIRLLRVIEERVFVDSCAKEYEVGILSSLPTIYKYTQSLLSARLAVDHPEQTYSILSEITQRFEHINSNNQREVLTYMLPWLRNVDLSVGQQDAELSSSAFMVCSNMFYITIKYGDVYVKEVAALWRQLVSDNVDNVRAIVMYLIDLGLEKRNPWFIIHAKRVLVCLGRTSAISHVLDEVIAEITPRSMVPQLKEASSKHANAFPFLFVADIEQVLPPYPKRPVFSRGQLATVFLVELAIEAGGELSGHLPLLLHSIFVQLDHLTSIICDQSRCLLINLIQSIVVRQTTDMEILQKATDVVNMLTAKEGKRLWSYENITYKNRNLQSSIELQQLLEQVVEIFTTEEPELRQKWGETALKWATCCSVRHIACRSFQCFRALMPAFNQHMLADMLARLSNTIADKSEDIRGFALEILLTLHKVADSLDGTISDHFLQLFWVSVACMYSPYEPEHHEAVQLLDKALSKIDADDTTAYGELAANFPKNWASEFDGLQPLLLKGVRMTATEQAALKLIKKTMVIDEPALIDPAETRLMYLVFACMPRLLHGLDDEVPDSDCVMLANSLARLFERYDLPSIQRILMTYSKQKSKFQQDYVKQLVMATREVFLQKYGQQAIAFSISLLRNKIPFYRAKTLMLLKELMPQVSSKLAPNMVLEEAALTPLLQLLQTEFAEEALAVMDEGISIKPSQQDSTESSPEPKLYWDVTDPIEAARVTRHNVHAVVFECSAVTDEMPSEHNFQFSVEDLSLLMGENAQIGSAEYAPADSNIPYGDDLVNALKDLDEFFNEDLDKTDVPVGSGTEGNDYPVDFNFHVAPPSPSPITPPIFSKTPSAIFDFSRKLINRASASTSRAAETSMSSNMRFPDSRTLDLPTPNRPDHPDHVINTVPPRESFDTTDSIDTSDSDSTFDDRLADGESRKSGKSGKSGKSRKSSKSHQHGHHYL
ncbi:hypothetical protein INT43_006925 [Umbelopsis isabellina]|uniref:Uncharacterized protein n=1 Tax=Mortierella isabellina TaxID=91625 RepID=A0A8H7PYX8_MORIS|nr:hypothetical protein INT43_006925 [Umbelopsis isabellina]